MDERRLRNLLAGYVLIGHFAVLTTAVVLFFLRGLLFEEAMTCVALIGPTLALYSSAAVKYVASNRQRRSSRRKVTTAFAVLSIALPSVFFLASIGLLLLKAFNIGFTSFEQFKSIMIAVQGAFGVYAGQMIATLFDVSAPATATAIATRPEHE